MGVIGNIRKYIQKRKALYALGSMAPVLAPGVVYGDMDRPAIIDQQKQEEGKETKRTILMTPAFFSLACDIMDGDHGNGDGKISRDEYLYNQMKTAWPDFVYKDEKNGKIRFELPAIIARHDKVRRYFKETMETLEKKFDKYDRDDDGFITKKDDEIKPLTINTFILPPEKK